MANPQKENGYTGFSNELFEALMRHRFTVCELKVIMKVARETYGWSRKKAKISYGSIARAIGFAKRNVIRACKSLTMKNVLFIQEIPNGSCANVIGINKNYEQWHCERIVDNSVGSDTGATRGVTLEPLGGVTREPPDVVTLEPPPLIKQKTNGKKAVKKDGRLVNNSVSVGYLIRGLESHITNGDPRPLVDELVREGFDLIRVWGTIVQARTKKNPAGYFVSALSAPKYAVADSAIEKAKAEMRKYGY